MTPRVIAIDGPAGSGKSTLARALGAELGLATLDTGATYRAVAAAALRAHVDLSDAPAVASIADVAELSIDGAVVINGIDVTEEIRSEDVNHAVSLVAANERVRATLVTWQRSWVTAHGGAVVEGRDIGTVVFPDATVKLFLTASAGERAKRRSEEGLASIERRDLLDSTRSASPLSMASDAFEIDTTSLSIEDLVAMVIQRVHDVEALGGNR